MNDTRIGKDFGLVKAALFGLLIEGVVVVGFLAYLIITN